METLCRLCMNFGAIGMEPIFRPFMASCLAAKIANVTQLTLVEGDGLPASVCQQCIFKLDVADSFIQKCTLSDRALRAMQTVQNECLTSSGSVENLYNRWQATSQSLDLMPSNSHRSTSDLRFGPSKDLQKDENRELSSTTNNTVKFIEDSDDADFLEADAVCDSSTTINLNPTSGERIAKDAIESLSEKIEQVSESDFVPNSNSKDKDSVDCSPSSEIQKEVESMPSQVFPEKLKCSICHNKFANKENLALHIKKHHKDETSHKCLKTANVRKARNLIPDKDSQTNSITPRPTKHNDASGSSNHPCSISGRSFLHKFSLKNHILGHSGARPKFSCNVCPKKYSNIITFKRHKLNHSKEYFTQEICKRMFKIKRSLADHVLSHSVERPFTCATCDKSFAKKTALRTHMKTHSEERPHECIECDKKFKRKDHLRRHVEIHEKNGLCQQKSDFKKSSLERTVNASDQDCVFPVTRQTLSNNTHVESQVNASHEDESENLFPCKDCRKTFSKDVDLDSHMLSHKVNVELFTCNHCRQDFSTHADLQSHTLIHEVYVENSFTTCKDCGQTFNDRTDLDIHKQSHNVINEKLFTCKLCERTFCTRTDIEGHMSIHEGARQYLFPCKVCGRRFTSEASVAHHMSIHVRASRHKCPKCTRSFQTTLGLKEHIKFHESNSKLMCSICSKTFTSQEDLETHSTSHQNELSANSEQVALTN